MSQIVYRRSKQNEFIQRFIKLCDGKGIQVAIINGFYTISVSDDDTEISFWEGPSFTNCTKSEFQEVFDKCVEKNAEIFSFFEELED